MDILREYSNHAGILHDLEYALASLHRSADQAPPVRLSVRSKGRAAPGWRTADRLTPEQEAEMVGCFMAGTPKAALAAKYGISESSVKRLLRRNGAKRTSWADRRPVGQSDA